MLRTGLIVYPKRTDPMSRYTHSASWYDKVSAEPIYRVGRERAIPALHLQEGSRVLDIGCGTGPNFPLLLAAVGPRGQVVGVDRSREMLEVARRKTIQTPPGNVALVEADAEHLDHVAAGLDGSGATFDAVLFTYSLSLMGNWEAAWRQATSLVRPGGRAGIVDMGLPMAGPGCSIRLPVWPVYSVGRISTHVRGLCSSEQHTTCSRRVFAAGTSR